MGLSIITAAGPRQRNHSWVRVSWDSWVYFTLSASRFPQPGGPGPRIHIPQEQGGPLIPADTEFLFRRLLRLVGLRWRYRTRLHTGLNSIFGTRLTPLITFRHKQHRRNCFHCCCPTIPRHLHRNECLFFACCIATPVAYSHRVATGLYAIILYF
jgi:hypothetical protein